MLTIESINPDSYLSAALAAYFARLSLPVWEKEYPEDSRPERALEAAEKALLSDAASYATDAASAANGAANAAAAIASAAAAAASASAAHAACALGKDERSFVCHHLIRLLPLILWHKMNSKRSFGKPEKVFELLPEACKEDFLFNLDSLR